MDRSLDLMHEPGGSMQTEIRGASWWIPSTSGLRLNQGRLEWTGEGTFRKDEGPDALVAFLRLAHATGEQVFDFAAQFGVLGLRWPIPDRRLGMVARLSAIEGTHDYVGRPGADRIELWRALSDALYQLLVSSDAASQGKRAAPKLVEALNRLGLPGRMPDEMLSALAQYRAGRDRDATSQRVVDPSELPGVLGRIDGLNTPTLSGEFWTEPAGVADAWATLAAWTGISFDVRVESGRLAIGVYPSTLAQVLVWKALLVQQRAKELVPCGFCGDVYDRRNKNSRSCGAQDCARQLKTQRRREQRASPSDDE